MSTSWDKLYETFGVPCTDNGGDNFQGTCPFCSDETRFGIAKETGMFQCVKCGEKGNNVSFLQRIYSELCTQDPEMLEQLAYNRNLPVPNLIRWGFAYYPQTDELVVPQHNPDGILTNLARVAIVEVTETKSGSKSERFIEWSPLDEIPEIGPKGGKVSIRLMNAPGAPINLFGPIPRERKNQKLQLAYSEQKSIYLTEGPWDGIALEIILDGNLTEKTYAVLAAPGTGTFNHRWFPLLKGKELTVCFDNDHDKRQKNTGKIYNPAQDAYKKIVKSITENGVGVESLSLLQWGGESSNSTQLYDSALPSGYDIRDLYNSCEELEESFSIFTSLIVPIDLESSLQENAASISNPPKEDIELIQCTDFDVLCDAFSSRLHFTDMFRDTLAIACSVVLSTKLRADQLWIRIIGPPGSGKSTVAECLTAAAKHCIGRSIVTGFHSGYRDTAPGQRGKDASLFATINGMCVIFKDADTLVTAPNRDKILAELRDLYDGSTSIQTRNNITRSYKNLRTTFILCGTDSLRSTDKSFLGERFLDCEIFREGDEGKYVDSAMENTFRLVGSSMTQQDDNDDISGEEMNYLKGMTAGFLNYITEAIYSRSPPGASPAIKLRLKKLAHLLAFARAKVERKGDTNDTEYQARIEVPSRIASQLTKLAICLAVVLNKSEIDDEVVRIVQKLVWDTAKSYQFQIINLLGNKPEGMTVENLAKQMRLNQQSVVRKLRDTVQLDITKFSERQNNSGVGGRDAFYYRLTEKVRRIWQIATGELELDEDPDLEEYIDPETGESISL